MYNCLAFSNKIKVIINNTILLDTSPDFLNNPLKVYCVPSVKLKNCGLLGQYQMIYVLMTFLLN